MREAISEYFDTHYGVKYDPVNEIIVTVGVSEGLAMALSAFVSSGDEVLIPDPAYVAYPASVQLAGGTPVMVPTYPEHDFKLSAEALEKLLHRRQRLLLSATRTIRPGR